MIQTFYFNDLRTCCYVLYDGAGECAIIDPGCIRQTEKDRLVRFIKENHLVPRMIIQTHGHFDHVMGNAFVASEWNIPTYLAAADVPQIRRASSYGSYFGYEFDQPSEDIRDMKDGDVINVGAIRLKVLASPGHTAGGVLLYDEEGGYVFTGDTLFCGSIGRTDLPGGDYDMLSESIRTKILPLPADTVVYPGHGPATDIGREKMTNPFLEDIITKEIDKYSQNGAGENADGMTSGHDVAQGQEQNG